MNKIRRFDLSIVIPCYNEEKNISLLVEQFKQVIPKNLVVELILVDNGSSDGTNKFITTLIKKNSFLKLVHVKKNIGYGFGIWSGLKTAKGEFIGWTHADLQTDIKDCFRAYEIINKNGNSKNCFIKGSRGKRPFFDTFFTLGMSIFETLILRKILYDINAQPKLFHKSFLMKIDDPPYDFSFDLYFYFMAKKLNYNILKFPVIFADRIHGVSHWNTGFKSKVKLIRRTIDYSFKLLKKV